MKWMSLRGRRREAFRPPVPAPSRGSNLPLLARGLLPTGMLRDRRGGYVLRDPRNDVDVTRMIKYPGRFSFKPI
jgi:hypothetical protein